MRGTCNGFEDFENLDLSVMLRNIAQWNESMIKNVDGFEVADIVTHKNENGFWLAKVWFYYNQ